MRHFILELLSALIGVCLWFFGWPILRDIQLALSAIGAAIAIVGILAGIAFLVIVIQSIRQPPYA
jgi:hypothetical protein